MAGCGDWSLIFSATLGIPMVGTKLVNSMNDDSNLTQLLTHGSPK